MCVCVCVCVCNVWSSTACVGGEKGMADLRICCSILLLYPVAEADTTRPGVSRTSRGMPHAVPCTQTHTHMQVTTHVSTGMDSNQTSWHGMGVRTA